MIYENESWWVEHEYSTYTDEEIDSQLERSGEYLDGHTKRLRFEKIKRLEAKLNNNK